MGVYVHVCVHACVCMYVCMCVCMHVCVYVCVHVCVLVCVCVYVGVNVSCVCENVYEYVLVHACVCVCIYVSVNVYACVCVCVCVREREREREREHAGLVWYLTNKHFISQMRIRRTCQICVPFSWYMYKNLNNNPYTGSTMLTVILIQAVLISSQNQIIILVKCCSLTRVKFTMLYKNN